MSENATPKSELNIAGKLAKAFIHSKITMMIMLAITLAGIMAYLITPREYNPQIVVPAANIIVPKGGATPEEVENMVVKPLETIMGALPGVDHTFGYAANDFGVVTVQFEVGQNQVDSLVKVYNQLMQNLDKMPPDTQQPLVKPINVDDVPIMTLAVTSKELSGYDLRDVALKLVENLRNIPGVSFTDVVGGKERAINVWLDARKIALTGLSLDTISEMLLGNNVSVPVGTMVNNNQNHLIRVNGYLGNAKEVGNIIIGMDQGSPIYLKDIATITDGPKETDTYTRIGFGPNSTMVHKGEQAAVTIALAKKPGTNAVDVANAVLDKLDMLKKSVLPSNVDVVVTRNDGEKANAAVNLLMEHLGIAVGSVIVILVLFLGWREASIVTLTVPLILFVVLFVGLIADQTINRITLFALILSLGLLVDAAIVVIENIHRHIHDGFDPEKFDEVLIRATNEIGNPTNVATIAVILAFIPMLFVTGMMGPFMAPIPFNVPVAMIASLVVAYILVPYAAYRFLGKKAIKEMQERESLETHHVEKEDWMQKLYVKAINPLIESRTKRNLFLFVVLGALIAAMVQPALQFVRGDGMNNPLHPAGVEVKMLPYDNTSTFLVQVDMPEGTALEATDRVVRHVGDLLSKTPFVTDYSVYLGNHAPIDFAALVRGDLIKEGSNFAQIRVNLVNKHQRSVSSHEIVNRFNDSLAMIRKDFPQANVKLYETPPGPPVTTQIMAELYGPDYDKLRAAAIEMRENFGDIYGLINVDDSVTDDQVSYEINIDRDQANLLGVAPAQVSKMLRDYINGYELGYMHLDNVREPVNIIVRLPRSDRTTPEQLLALRIQSRGGDAVPLSAVAKIEKSTHAKPIVMRDQHRMVMIGGELLKSSPVYAVLSLDKMLDNVTLPKTGVTFHTANLGFVEAQPHDVMEYTLLWGGEMRLTLDVFRDMGSAFIVALVFIYLILVGYYKSFMMPVIVMGAIPLTMIGVFPGHWLTGQAFTATSMIGVIALAGIVVRNSLLLIDFILEYRAEGQSLKDAVIEAGKVRFRPILLTALAIMFGSMIMITDPVFGGLAVSLIFGTLSSTVLTLLVIPLLYYIWQWHGGVKQQEALARQAVTQA
ncbi:efflux RND transporter permease subunit [Thiomicrorhabdus heinhorstiae]|uniref:Efflux RND transporter permease subunit n=1 Tax=Thiomicrorhabdus heinhorstiae TaxID=2748010 RepID=A0ABS0BWJ9_9GAMM|nr:efflux RND transporter permease subunit [Thiomicrorhabdus heinhorstiae]MBF6058185.1 efflux RND transporter permease subunit [Thiomicrorhabdus heinhorstiae]